MNILIVGAGQLGSRHLQSCLKLKQKAYIYVVDNNVESLNLCKVRESEIEKQNEHEIYYFSSIQDVNNKDFNVMICATSAAPRYQLLKSCLSIFNVEYTIIEKVLFQSLEDYKNANKLLLNSNTRAYVNCPLRTYPFYKKIKNNYLKDIQSLNVNYSGGEWIGLACNSIHYIDLVNYLTDKKLLSVNAEFLDKDIIDSKRQGYIELTGQLTCSYERGTELTINSKKNSNEKSTIELDNGKHRFVIDEITGCYEIFLDGILIESSKFELIYQSDLTHRIIQQLVERDDCDLISFDKSSNMHQILIKELLCHYNKNSEQISKILPLT